MNNEEKILLLLDKENFEKVEIITNKNIFESVKKSEFFELLTSNEKIEFIITKKDINLFITCGDEFISVTLFLKDGYYDDSQILIDETNNGLEWGLEIFNEYKNKGEKIKI